METSLRSRKLRLVLLLLAISLCQGCAQGIVRQRAFVTRNTIPAHRLPPEFCAVSKNNLVPIEWTRLRRPPVREHVIGPDDVLGVHIEEVLPTESTSPTVFYPVQEQLEAPSVGQPIRVRSDGTIALPLVDPVNVAGLSVPAAVEKVRQVYLDKGILTAERIVTIDLIRARTVKVFVVRDDTGPLSVNVTKRGTTTALDLPVFENDVLHALSQSGGLPAEDGYNEIWILRGATVSAARREELVHQLKRSFEDDVVSAPSEFTRIPLRVCPGQEIPFRPQDVVLHDGDVVFIESRIEFFLTGGLVGGGKFDLPRDQDVDVIEAISIAGTNAFGPVGTGIGNNFRGGPGAVIAPTQIIVVRQLDSGEQIRIAVDVRAALNDPNERLVITHRDLILLQYKPHELFGNLALNVLGLNVFFDNATLRVN